MNVLGSKDDQVVTPFFPQVSALAPTAPLPAGSKNSKKKSRKQKVKKGSGLDVPRLGGAQCCQQSLAHTHFGLAKGLWGDCERTCSWGRTPGSWNLADFSYIISRNNCLNLTNQVLLCCKKGSNLWILIYVYMYLWMFNFFPWKSWPFLRCCRWYLPVSQMWNCNRAKAGRSKETGRGVSKRVRSIDG